MLPERLDRNRLTELPSHLLLPLLASLLFVCGLICTKRATSRGVSPWTVVFLANQWAALLFSTLWLLGGEGQPLAKLWQPAIIGLLYMAGQIFTFLAIQRGDVSVATPVLGIKVVLVAILVSVLFREMLPQSVWIAAGLATVGIGLVQWSPRVDDGDSSRGKLLTTILFAVLAASAFAMFDVSVQRWAPAWGTGRILPAVFWMVSILSLGLLPFVSRSDLRDPQTRTVLLVGTFLIGLQALCLVSTLANFGDAARVNVVYSMRAVWGVVLAWLVAIKWGGGEADAPKSVMLLRLLGAILLTAAVVLVV